MSKTKQFYINPNTGRKEITPEEFWELKNSIISFPTRQYQTDARFVEYELECIETASVFYLFSKNAKELGMPYHKILTTKLLSPDGQPIIMHGNVIGFEGKAKDLAKAYFLSIPLVAV